MAVIVYEEGMSSERKNENGESSHEFNFFLDRQLQNKLIQADDALDADISNSVNFKQGNNVRNGNGKIVSRQEAIKFEANEYLSGWFPDEKVVARKPDKDVQKAPVNFIHPWRDYKKQQDNFVFKHYTDNKKYIEQYRREHGCHVGNRYPSGSEMRKYAAQNTAPPQPLMQVQSVWGTGGGGGGGATTTSASPALHYTTRREGSLVATPNSNQNGSCNKTQAQDTSSQAYRYKLCETSLIRSHTVTESDNSSESDKAERSRTPRSNSAKAGIGRTAGRSPTKVSVPAPHGRPYPLQALTLQQANAAKNGEGVPPQNMPGASTKPLDTLNCVAAEKQKQCRTRVEPLGLTLQVHNMSDLLTTTETPLQGHAMKKHRGVGTLPNSHSDDESDTVLEAEDSDCVSIEQLSTCCLMAEVQVKDKSDPTKSHAEKPGSGLTKISSKADIANLNTSVSMYFNTSTHKLFQDIPRSAKTESEAESQLRVSMWNPVVSMPQTPEKELGSKEFRNIMLPSSPFKKPSAKLAKGTIKDTTSNGIPLKRSFKLSITRMDSAVTFCRTQEICKKGSNSSKGQRLKKAVSSADLNVHSAKRHMLNLPEVHDRKHDKVQNTTEVKCVENIHTELPHIHEQKTENKRHEQTEKMNNLKATIANSSDKEIICSGIKSQWVGPPGSFDSSKWRLPAKGNDSNSDEVEVIEREFRSATKPYVGMEGMQNGKIEQLFTLLPTDTENETHNDIPTLELPDISQENNQNNKPSTADSQSCVSDRSDMEKPKRRGPAIANGKCLEIRPDLEGLTWSEKLEILRSVNKRPLRPKPKPRKLKYVKDKPESDYNSADKDQLYEQRRIKHLLEQARIKGGNQFDWVYEAQVKLRGFRWDSTPREGQMASVDTEITFSSSDDSDVDDDGNSFGLSKFGIEKAKDADWRMRPPGAQRSNTCLFPT